jgi:DNA-3-methyladenine glycosylase I
VNAPDQCFSGEYHDREWGRPVTDERGLLERVCLEGFQSGLSWAVILRKREALRTALQGFGPEALAALGDQDVARMMGDPALVRNRAKLRAAIGNARATLTLRERGTPLHELIWSFRPPPRPAPVTRADLPASTDASAALAAELRRAGFRFVGPTTAYALMQACGLVNDHLAACPIRAEVGALQGAAARAMAG